MHFSIVSNIVVDQCPRQNMQHFFWICIRKIIIKNKFPTGILLKLRRKTKTNKTSIEARCYSIYLSCFLPSNKIIFTNTKKKKGIHHTSRFCNTTYMNRLYRYLPAAIYKKKIINTIFLIIIF